MTSISIWLLLRCRRMCRCGAVVGPAFRFESLLSAALPSVELADGGTFLCGPCRRHWPAVTNTVGHVGRTGAFR